MPISYVESSGWHAIKSTPRGEMSWTYDMNPDVKAALTGISFPLSSRLGIILNTLRINAIAMKTELSAMYLPGQILLFFFKGV